MISKDTLKAIDPYVRQLSGNRLYTEYTIGQTEFVGSTSIDIATVQEKLLNGGYEEPPTLFGISLEAAKSHYKTDEIHDFSLRKVDPENNSKQYHIHGWERGELVHISSHLEYRPDFTILEGETLSDTKTRLATHLKPEYGSEYIQGAMDPELEGLLNE